MALSESSEIFLTREQVREVDRLAIEELGIPGIVLMENASAGAARIIAQTLGPPSAPVLIPCGAGNNGGDGYAIARHLNNMGFEVHILASGKREELRGDARINADIAFNMGIPAQPLHANLSFGKHQAKPACVIDALLGTGFEGALREPLASDMEGFRMFIRALELPVFAIDLPSGMDANTGTVTQYTWKAQHTLTFVAPKVGFQEKRAQRYVGQVHVVPIGTPHELVQRVIDESR